MIADSVERLIKKISSKKSIILNTKTMKNGIECLYEVYKEIIEGKRIDVLLIDENMPFMLGSECIKILKKLMLEKKIHKFKIISITGYTDPDTINFIKASGSDDFYNKPISLTMMNDLLMKSDIIK